MDAFFASVEQRDNPALRGKPIAVGGRSDRGVISAASYEARRFGVRSAMSSQVALKRCPHLILVPSNFEAYKEASRAIREIFFEYTDLVEPLSLDEAYLDVTFSKSDLNSATLIAEEIRKKIFECTGLTASAGVSFNKFLAKVASDVNKPNGICVITQADAAEFLNQLKIDRFFGVGKVAAQKMKSYGIYSGKDLKKLPLHDLERWFGKSGAYYYNIVRGIDNREVQPHRERKSQGAEETFRRDITDPEQLSEQLRRVIDRLWRRIENLNLEAKTLTLKIKFSDFEVISRSHTTLNYFQGKDAIESHAFQLFEAEGQLIKPVRLIGVSLSNFKKEDDKPSQLELFG